MSDKVSPLGACRVLISDLEIGILLVVETLGRENLQHPLYKLTHVFWGMPILTQSQPLMPPLPSSSLRTPPPLLPALPRLRKNQLLTHAWAHTHGTSPSPDVQDRVVEGVRLAVQPGGDLRRGGTSAAFQGRGGSRRCCLGGQDDNILLFFGGGGRGVGKGCRQVDERRNGSAK